MTYDDPQSKEYGRRRFGHNEGLFGILARRFGIMEGKRKLQSLPQLESQLFMAGTVIWSATIHPDDPNHAAWIAARAAVDLRAGTALGRRAEDIISDPVVRIALDEAERLVNAYSFAPTATTESSLTRCWPGRASSR